VDLALTDKVIFITGASGGIGRALGEVFAAEGAQLALGGRGRFDELEAWLGAQPWKERAVALRADVSERAEVEGAMEAAVERFGRVDVCVANAGVWPKADLLLHEVSEERIRSTIETNLMGALWTARAFMAALARTGPRDDGHGAALTFIGSTAGRFGERGHAEYSVSKAGMLGLVRTLKNEIVQLDPYARVNLVEPGWTVTHMVREEIDRPGAIRAVTRTMPLCQLGRAVDIARTVAVLSSHVVSRHTSGQTLTVAGGMEGRSLWSAEDIDEDAVRARLGSD
jgi:3-oxoacyl-[acyl-carrier protein] reductase